MKKLMTESVTNSSVTFEKQLNGYDRGQVDQYIARLAEAYQEAYDEYTSISDKNDDLLKEIEELKKESKNAPNAEVITKTLLSSEILAQKTLEDADEEAGKMIAKAQAESRMIIADACAEQDAAKAKAERIIKEAKIEAARNISKADQELMTIYKKREMLSSEISNIISKLETIEFEETGGETERETGRETRREIESEQNLFIRDVA
jgi:DivIVA domain-containing protein